MRTSKDSMWWEIWKILQNFSGTKQGLGVYVCIYDDTAKAGTDTQLHALASSLVTTAVCCTPISTCHWVRHGLHIKKKTDLILWYVPCVYVHQIWSNFSSAFERNNTACPLLIPLFRFHACIFSPGRADQWMDRILGCPLFFFHFVVQGLTFYVCAEHPKHPGQTQGLLLVPIPCLQKRTVPCNRSMDWPHLNKLKSRILMLIRPTPGQTACLPSGPSFRHRLWWDINQKPVNCWIICRLPHDPKFLGLPCMHQWWHVVICQHNFHRIYYPQPSRASQ